MTNQNDPKMAQAERLAEVRRLLRKLEGVAEGLATIEGTLAWSGAGSLGHMVEELATLAGERG
jgi:hypothetical protein